MVGFDTVYRRDYTDRELARISVDENRILLTRDLGLLKRNAVIRGYFIRATNPRDQLVEVLRRFDLVGSISPFERCIHCNNRLRPIAKELAADRLLQKRGNITRISVYARLATESIGKDHITIECRASLKAFPQVTEHKTE